MTRPSIEGVIVKIASKEMANGPVTAKMLAVICNITEHAARYNLRVMHESGLTYINSWHRYSDRGSAVPRYALKPGTDAPKPKPMSGSERMKRYRRENPEYSMRDNASRRAVRSKRKAGIKKPGLKPDFWRM